MVMVHHLVQVEAGGSMTGCPVVVTIVVPPGSLLYSLHVTPLHSPEPGLGVQQAGAGQLGRSLPGGRLGGCGETHQGGGPTLSHH